jgi:hypothetical protein
MITSNENSFLPPQIGGKGRNPELKDQKENSQPMVNKHNMKYYIMKTYHEGLHNVLLALLLFMAPIKGILITVGAFIILDTASGIWKSIKKKVPITSRGLSAIISKMLLYQLTVITTYLLDYYILGEIIYGLFSIDQLLTKIVAMVLVFIEAQSINENYKEIRGVDLWEQFKKLLSRAKEAKDDFKDISKKG